MMKSESEREGRKRRWENILGRGNSLDFTGSPRYFEAVGVGGVSRAQVETI